MAKIVRHTPDGGLPGDLPAEGDKEPAVSELRLNLGITAKTVVERGLQAYSLAQGRPVPLAEAVEALFAKLLQKEIASDLETLSKSQKEARKDLWADHCRREPLLREARELAQSMGLAGLEDGDAVTDFTPSVEQMAGELLESVSLEMSSPLELDQHPAQDISALIEPQPCPARGNDTQWEDLLKTYQVNNLEALSLKQSDGVPSPMQGDDIGLLANDWRNRRLRFNEDARKRSVTAPVYPAPPTSANSSDATATAAALQAAHKPKALPLRLHLWIESHHIVFYSQKGKTICKNVISICSRCHKNVHRGHLRISGQAPDQLVFTDRHGRDLRRSHELNVAGWLDFWLGWEGGPEDSHIVTFTVISTAGPKVGANQARSSEDCHREGDNARCAAAVTAVGNAYFAGTSPLK